MRAHVVQVLRHWPNRLTAVVKFQERVRIENVVVGEPFLVADVSVSPVVPQTTATPAELAAATAKARGFLATLVAEAQVARDPKADKDDKDDKGDKAKVAREELDRPRSIAALTDARRNRRSRQPFVELERDDQTFLLCELDPALRLQKLLPELERRATVLRIKADLGAELEGEIAKTQRERVLRDRARQIQEELGEADDNAEIDELRTKIDDSKMTDEVRAVARKQLSRMCDDARAPRPSTTLPAPTSRPCSTSRAAPTPTIASTCRPPARCSKSSTRASTRLKNASSSSSRSRSSRPTSTGRSCCWRARPASARPRSAAPSPGARPQIRPHLARRRAR